MKYNLEGQRFGKLIVKKEYGKNKRQEILWECLCDCGKITIVPTFRLTSGKTRSCGCLREVHKMATSRLYKIWYNMKSRCYKSNTHEFEKYGGKGIKICDEWQTFIPFMEWSLSHGYSDNLTIDRKDINKDYSPDNCRWITLKEQQKNKSDNINLTYNGETHILADWSRKTGINYPTLQGRYRRGWSVERMLTTPVHKRYSHRVNKIKELSE